MDPASAIAGFIALAALTAKSATKITSAFRTVKQTPKRLEKNLRGLSQLTQLLVEIGDACQTLEQSDVKVNFELMRMYLQDCLDALQPLEAKVEVCVENLGNKSKVKRNMARLRAALDSKEVEAQLQDIENTMNGISVCHSSIVMQALAQSSSRMARIEQLFTRKIAENEEFQQAVLSVAEGIQNGQASLHDQMVAMSVSLTGTQLELLSSGAELISSSDGSTTLIQKPSEHFVDNTFHSFSESGFDQSQFLRDSLEHSSFESSSSKSHYLNSDWSYRSSYSSSRRKEPPSHQPYTPSSHLRVSNTFGTLYLSTYWAKHPDSRKGESKSRQSDEVIEVNLILAPSPVLCRRALQASLIYSQTHGLLSPSTIRIHFPCVRPVDDAMVDEMRNIAFDDFKVMLVSNGYRPNDLFMRKSGRCWSMLRMAIGLDRVDICEFLLGHGATVDASTSSGRSAQYSWDLTALFDLIGQHTFTTIDRRQSYLMLLRKLLDQDALLPQGKIITRVHIQWFDDIMKILLNHPACIIEFDLASISNDAEAVSFQWYKHSVEARLQDNGAKSSTYDELALKYKFNLRAADSRGWTPLHIFCVTAINDGFLEHQDKEMQLLMGNSVTAQVKCMLMRGADLYTRTANNVTPTLLVLLWPPLYRAWFRALHDLGINSEALVRHTLQCLNTSILKGFLFKHEEFHCYLGIESTLIPGQQLPHFPAIGHKYENWFARMIATNMAAFGGFIRWEVAVMLQIREFGVHLEPGLWMFEGPTDLGNSSGTDFSRVRASREEGVMLGVRRRPPIKGAIPDADSE